jgi:hypothetical protein
MLRSSILALILPLLAAVPPVKAQTTVTVGSFGFSNGVHPTIDFIFEGTDTKYVESYWRDELKKISHDVSNKKEVIGHGVLLPQVSPDTVRVLVKAEQRKGSPLLTAHVAILTTQGYVGAGGDPAVLEAAKAFVQRHSTALRRQLAQQELTDAEKGLSRLRNELSMLQREKERAAASIEKRRQKAAEALDDQEKARKLQEELAPRVEAKRNEVAAETTPEDTKELNALLKEQAKAVDAERRAVDTQRSMEKKAADLAWTIKQNEQEQERKATAIARQEELVKALREKVAAIQ